jgi:hypothetical protein
MPVAGNDLSLNSNETPIYISITVDATNEDILLRYSLLKVN